MNKVSSSLSLFWIWMNCSSATNAIDGDQDEFHEQSFTCISLESLDEDNQFNSTVWKGRTVIECSGNESDWIYIRKE